MPLKITCARCGELLYYASAYDMANGDFCIPDIIFGKNSKLHGECPSCKRKFSQDDIATMHIQITGKPGDAEFYAKGGKKKRQNRDHWLWIGNDLPARIEPMWQWHPRSKTERNQP